MPPRHPSFRLATLIAAFGAIAACASPATLPPNDGDLALGTWGGDSAGMIVGDTAMHIHIRCTYGDVSGRIPLDADGTFDVTGSYMLRAFPIAIPPAVPARFTGIIHGADAVITVTVSDTVNDTTVVLGPVRVTYNKAPREMPCPICRRPVYTRRTP